MSMYQDEQRIPIRHRAPPRPGLWLMRARVDRCAAVREDPRRFVPVPPARRAEQTARPTREPYRAAPAPYRTMSMCPDFMPPIDCTCPTTRRLLRR